ncbi:glucuronate isomerase [Curtobacterium ammoniigenes]|uniref:glucuronate isomerase n=1 Tax=Curtobacterium ammoniigenes TaxID=395387 RepID=UPI00082E6B96|nr:glucuronate isomerase [Curtobacterium ammoniigenes]
MQAPLVLDPDRLFPVDPATRTVARELYESVRTLPIISPHGHVDPRMLLDDPAFPNPSELFIRYDHYVTRVLHAAGVDLTALGVPTRDGSETAAVSPRTVWRTFCEHWPHYAGTASGYWLQDTLVSQFGISVEPSAESADTIYDAIQRRLDDPDFRPRALLDRFRIDFLATTDDPLDDLAAHRSLAADPSLRTRVAPTFRPDPYIDPNNPGFANAVQRIAEWGGFAADDFGSYRDALADRRRYFVEHGAVSADHGVLQPFTEDLPPAEAEALFRRVVAGTADAEERTRFAAVMLFEMARMSVEDGLVMTVHPGVVRNHHAPTFDRFGPDMGHDVPTATRYVEPLRPLLDRFGTNPEFHLVLFTVDETTFSREIAPLAGFYPSVYIGAPWWFLDAPDAVQRFRAAVTETAGFYRGSGFIDDTRAFLSIPARHDMSRRIDAAYLARLVGEGRVSRSLAERIIRDLVATVPKQVFKL